MTLGEKIRAARAEAGLSQQQLAEKLNVSRSAVAKWETDKGMPDIENLRALSALLETGLDSLLSDSSSPLPYREKIDLTRFGKGRRKVKKDRLMRTKFPECEIRTLLGRVLLTRGEKIVDNVLGIFTDAPFGIPDFINSIKNLDREYYLVKKSASEILLVTVTDSYMESRPLPEGLAAKKFTFEGIEYTDCRKIIY